MMSSDSIWSRSRGYDEISANVYNLIFALTTVYGLFVFGFLANMFLTVELGTWTFLGLFAVSIVGCFITASESSAMNLVGLSMIAGGLGGICGPFINQYKVGSVIDIAGMTIVVTLILGAIGTIYPRSLENWGMLLFSFLVALLLAQIFLPIAYSLLGLPQNQLHTFLDWAGVILFSGYIIFDFNRAQHLPKTVDNAMDCGVAVFLDITNLFIRLLSLFGVKNDD